MISDQTRRQKSREVSSRYLSPTVAPSSPPLGLNNNHTDTLSPNRHNPKSSSSTKHKHKHTGFIRGLWSSSATHSSKSHNENQPTTAAPAPAATTLADYLRKEGDKKSPFLSKQKSCSEFKRSEKNSNTKNNFPIYGGGSARYNSGKFLFPGRSSISPSTSSSSSTKSSDIFDSNQTILRGRLSVDENALRRRSSYLSDNSENRDLGSPFTTGRNSTASYMAPTLSSKKSELDHVASIPMHNYYSPSKNSTTTFKSSAMKRVTSISSSSEWESSPSRLGSPLFSSSKPPTSTSGSRGKKNILHMGLDLIKGKKGGLKSRCSSALANLDAGTNMENAHQLRLLQNSWMQWRYMNARAKDVHEKLAAQCEDKVTFTKKVTLPWRITISFFLGHNQEHDVKVLECKKCTRISEDECFKAIFNVAKLRQSVVRKRLQLQKENLEMKLNLILHSQMKRLEAWENIERRHILDISVLRDYLHAVICMIPLIEGAKVDLESATLAFQHTSHLVTTIKSMLSPVSPIAHETMVTISELAEVVTQEKLLLEECFEHFRIISTLEIQERNLRCSIIAMDSLISDSEQQQN